MWGAAVDVTGLLGSLAALVFLLARTRDSLRADARALFAALLFAAIFRNLSNALEWLQLTAALEEAERYLEVVCPILWGVFFYALVQAAVQRELSDSEERNRILLASLPQRAFFKDQQSIFVSVNEPFAQDLGLRPEDIVGKTDWDFYPTELAAKYRADDDRVIREQRPETLVEKNVAGGVERTVEVVKAPVVNDQGEVIGLFGIFSDVTQRVRAEGALRESERFLGSIFSSIQDGLSILDADMRIVRVNPAIEQWYAHAMPLVGKKCYEAFHGRTEPCEICPSRQTLSTGNAAFAMVPKTGPGAETVGWLDLYSFPLIDTHTAQLKGVIEYVRDISQRKEAEDALQHRIQLERLITNISSSFINLSHEGIDEGITGALRALGEFAGVDRSYVFQFRDGGARMDNTHEWCAEGIAPQMPNLQNISLGQELPWFAQRIRQREVFHVPRVVDLPPTARREKEHFQMQDIQSLIAVPMVSEGDLIGFLGFDSVRSEKAWQEDVIVLLQVIGGVFSNALARKRAEEARRASEDKYRLVFEHATDMIGLHTLPDLRYLYVNPATITTLGYSEEELIGKSAFDYVHADDRDAVTRAISEGMVKGEARVELRYRRKDGAYLWLEATGKVMPGEGNALVGLIMARDITERVARREELRALSVEDPLTRLNNRRGFYHLAEQQLKVATRTKSPMLLFFMDVDDMKWINDNLGHKEGDLALIEAGNVLKEAFRESDIVGRVGGDEFAVLALQTGSAEAGDIMQRLQQRLAARNAQPGRRYRLSLSVGIASYEPDNPLPLDELMASADALMYENKRTRRQS